MQTANAKNEAAAYHLFTRWLTEVELLLERENRLLLLAFDEFEKLDDAGQRNHLDLTLLLDWFRTIIQHSTAIALLFSGVSTFAELSAPWAHTLVNVQVLKVSFLRRAEAYQLITHPTEHFPGEHIFGDEVVEEILSVTAGHPFLIQGVCSALITHLNLQGRFPTQLPDVAIAIQEFFRGWWDTYFRDLSERTDAQQRICLVALRQCRPGNLAQDGLDGQLEQKAIHAILATLVKRDLVVQEQGYYRIAAPLLSQWVERAFE